MDPAVIAVAFGAIFLVELPDKTFVAALVLSTRYRPLAVWVGVGLAFLVQTAIACTVGGLVTLLPHTVVEIVAGVIFLAGAVLLLREAPYPHPEQQLDHWIAEAVGSGLPEFAAFVTKLRQDRAAVLAGLQLLWSQGQTEGQITKLKLLKRSMYGRAKFDLLRQRMLHTQAAA